MSLEVVQDFGENKAGDVIEIADEKAAQLLVDAGLCKIAEAKAEDDKEENKDDAKPEEEAKSFARGVRGAIEKEIATLAKETAKKSLKAVNRPSLGGVPAQVKNKIFNRSGEFFKCAGYAAMGDVSASLKIAEFKKERQEAIKYEKTATGQSEATDTSLYPTDWSTELFVKARNKTFLLPMTKTYTSDMASFQVPVINDSSRATGSRPLRYYKIGETSDYTASAISFNKATLNKYKYGVLAGLTVEQLEDDAYNIERVITDQIAEELRFAYNDLIVNGAGGASDPVGILNANCLVSVASSTPAGKVYFTDTKNMYARLPQELHTDACWLVNQDIYGQFVGMSWDESASAKVPAWGLTYNPQNNFQMMLHGLPVYVCETCARSGNPGDIILWSGSQFATVDSGIDLDFSKDIRFVQDEILYKGKMRFDQEPLWLAAMTPFTGDTNRKVSPAIVLASRGTAT